MTLLLAHHPLKGSMPVPPIRIGRWMEGYISAVYRIDYMRAKRPEEFMHRMFPGVPMDDALDYYELYLKYFSTAFSDTDDPRHFIRYATGVCNLLVYSLEEVKRVHEYLRIVPYHKRCSWSAFIGNGEGWIQHAMRMRWEQIQEEHNALLAPLPNQQGLPHQ